MHSLVNASLTSSHRHRMMCTYLLPQAQQLIAYNVHLSTLYASYGLCTVCVMVQGVMNRFRRNGGHDIHKYRIVVRCTDEWILRLLADSARKVGREEFFIEGLVWVCGLTMTLARHASMSHDAVGRRRWWFAPRASGCPRVRYDYVH